MSRYTDVPNKFSENAHAKLKHNNVENYLLDYQIEL